MTKIPGYTETQGRRLQKVSTSVATQKGLMSSKFFLKNSGLASNKIWPKVVYSMSHCLISKHFCADGRESLLVRFLPNKKKTPEMFDVVMMPNLPDFVMVSLLMEISQSVSKT